MKKQLSTLIILTILFGFGSCKKDDSSSGTSTPTPSSAMSAKVDGVDWTSLSSKTSGSIMNNVSTCTGIAADSSRITFTVNQTVALNGTYNIGFGSGNVATYAASASTAAWFSNGDVSCTGTLTVTALNTTTKRMSGTFTFKGYRASNNTYKNITVGVFTNVAYQTGTTSGSNTFTVKINNVNWVPDLILGNSSGGYIDIEASNTAGDKSILLSMPDNITPGVYTLDGTGVVDAYYFPNIATAATASAGTLNITSHNFSTNTIVGTFNFNAVDISGGSSTYSITNGAFTVNY